MATLVVCEGCSSAILYVEEAEYRGWDILVVNPPRFGNEMSFQTKLFEERAKNSVKIINMKGEDEYPALVEKLKKMDVVAVVCGSECGVVYADRLSKELGLKGNDPEDTYKRITKKGMHDSLKKAGLRYIRTAVVKSENDIEKFWSENKIKTAFMKLNRNVSSIGSKYCETKEEAIEHFRKIDKKTDAWGFETEVIIQEFIGGTEYIVDTVSCNGKHYLTDIWKYGKVKTDTGEIVYNTCILVTDAEVETPGLIDYAFKVLDATGFKYGPCHGEYKVDENGPVLIETNARPIGGNLKSVYLDECLEHHVSDLALNAYVSSDNFFIAGNKLYRPKSAATFILMVIPKDLDADLSALNVLLKSMRSFRFCEPPITPGVRHYDKTVDMETSPYIFKLCGTKEDVKRDVDTLEKLVFDYQKMIFSAFDKLKEGRQDLNLNVIRKYFDKDNKILMVTNDGESISCDNKVTPKSKEYALYDGCIYAKTDCKNFYELYISIINALKPIRFGGTVLFLPGVYENIPYGPAAIGIIMEALNIRIEIPFLNVKGILYGRKL